MWNYFFFFKKREHVFCFPAFLVYSKVSFSLRFPVRPLVRLVLRLFSLARFMGAVVPLFHLIHHSFSVLVDSVGGGLALVGARIIFLLSSAVSLVDVMAHCPFSTGGSRLRALLTLGAANICGYSQGGRDVSLAACVELIHAAPLMPDDVIDNSEISRGKKTLNNIWGDHSSLFVGDSFLSRCFAMMVDAGHLEILKLLSSTSAEISQGEVFPFPPPGDIDMLAETYFKKKSAKTASLFAAAP
jgi:Geranylgeranyl pyrophosphate synthase